MAKEYKIPFDKDGNQLSYEGYRAEFADNFEFEDTLVFTGEYGRGVPR